MNARLAILGATGLVGRTMLAVVEERNVTIDDPVLLASERSEARALRFRGHDVPVRPVSAEGFRDVDFALFGSANAVSQQWAPVAREAGAAVVDNSSAFRYAPEVPLVVPEINGDLLEARPTLVANPNCSTIAIVMALAPLVRRARLERLVISTYQSVSGAGSQALHELEQGIRGGLDGPPPRRPEGAPAFAFNVVPQIDRFEDNGYSREEMKVVWETRKILGLPGLPVTATAVRVPVRVGHAASVNAVFERPVSPEEAREAWSAFPGLRVCDDPTRGIYPTPLDVAGRDEVLVGRARCDLSHARGLDFFVVSDNLRKGAALNAVQIVERLAQAGVGSGR